MVNKLVKMAFWAVGLAIAATLLWMVFFGGGIGGNNAITSVCRAVEEPISQTYYELIYCPSISSSKSASEGLEISIDSSSDLSGDKSPDDASDKANYSTGWRQGY